MTAILEEPYDQEKQIWNLMNLKALPLIISEKKPQIEKPSKQETKKAKKEFLEQAKTEVPEEVKKLEAIDETEDYKPYDATKTLMWLDEYIEEGREKLRIARSPQTTIDPYKQREIDKERNDFMTDGIFVLAEQIIHCMESLILHAGYNENVFGEKNFMLNDITVEIFGYQKIKEKMESSTGRETLIWFSRLLNCAARPLQVHEELVKQKIYTPSIGDTGLTHSLERG